MLICKAVALVSAYCFIVHHITLLEGEARDRWVLGEAFAPCLWDSRSAHPAWCQGYQRIEVQAALPEEESGWEALRMDLWIQNWSCPIERNDLNFGSGSSDL